MWKRSAPISDRCRITPGADAAAPLLRLFFLIRRLRIEANPGRFAGRAMHTLNRCKFLKSIPN
ncbi:hypothetical protein GFL43_03965 [Rhizobium laguerreae]|nr:hypothetical protein [Rhizobium laguerreae]